MLAGDVGERTTLSPSVWRQSAITAAVTVAHLA